MQCLYENAECSSACGSGWTVYLEYTSVSPWSHEISYSERRRRRRRRNEDFVAAKRLQGEDEEEEDDDEDLSMVSDASSGPPHLLEEGCDYGGNISGGYCYYCPPLARKKSGENRRLKMKDQSSLLDDTASSPFLDFSTKAGSPLVENASEYSQGFSTTHFQVRSPYEQYHDFFQSSPGKQLQQQNQG